MFSQVSNVDEWLNAGRRLIEAALKRGDAQALADIQTIMDKNPYVPLAPEVPQQKDGDA